MARIAQRSSKKFGSPIPINSYHYKTGADYVCFISPLEKAKLARKISDGKNKIPHKFFSRKI